MYRLSILMIGVFLISGAAKAREYLPGLYAGYMLMEERDEKIPVTLRMLKVAGGQDEAPLYMAFLKQELGSFLFSTEYNLNSYLVEPSEGGLALVPNEDGNSSGLEFVSTSLETQPRMSAEGETVDAVVRISGRVDVTLRGHRLGELHLVHESVGDLREEVERFWPDLPVIRTLTGIYTGSCRDGRDIMVQVETTKKYGSSQREQSPMHGYVITGRKAYKESRESDLYRMTPFFNFNDGQFNQYTGRVHFPHIGKTCTISRGRMTCEESGCELDKLKDPNSLASIMGDLTSGPSDYLEPSQIEQSRSWFDPLAEFSEEAITPQSLCSDAQGDFEGYLYISGRGEFEPVEISTRLSGFARRGDTCGGRALSLTSTVYVNNDPDNGYLSVTMPFSPEIMRDFGESLVLAASDSVVEVSHWSKNLIAGNWYSRSYGYVGPFAVLRDGKGAGSHKLGSREQMRGRIWTSSAVSGRFRNENTSRSGAKRVDSMQIFLADEAVGTPSYFPFAFRNGLFFEYVRSPDRREHTTTSTLNTGRYDPFTGAIGLEFSSGMSIIGRHYSGSFNYYKTPRLDQVKRVRADESVQAMHPGPLQVSRRVR